MAQMSAMQKNFIESNKMLYDNMPESGTQGETVTAMERWAGATRDRDEDPKSQPLTPTDCSAGVSFLQLCHGADGNVRRHRPTPRLHPGGEGGAHLHPLPGGTGSDGPGPGHGADCVCPALHSVDAVQGEDASQPSRWSVSHDYLWKKR